MSTSAHPAPAAPAPTLRLAHDGIEIGGLTVRFIRTLRLPDDGRTYPLPPGLGAFPLRRVDDYRDRVPAAWTAHGGVFLPMYQREAMWLSFHASPDAPVALKVAAGKVNAVSGDPWDEELRAGRQDYAVCPDQPWLDGFNAGEGRIRQFIAMPLGMGYTVEGQITGEERVGGLQLVTFALRPERARALAEERRRQAEQQVRIGLDSVYAGGPPGMHTAHAPEQAFAACAMAALAAPAPAAGTEMGLAAGGWMRQQIAEDRLGADAWAPTRTGRVFVHLCTSHMWRDITGEAAPESPVSARTYTEHGLPWFDYYGESDVAASEALAGVKSVAEKDAEHGFTGLQDDTPIDVPDAQVTDLTPNGVRDGAW